MSAPEWNFDLFGVTAALVADTAQAAHLHIMGKLAGRATLCALLHTSLCTQIGHLEDENPEGAAALIDLIRGTIETYDKGKKPPETATPAGAA